MCILVAIGPGGTRKDFFGAFPVVPWLHGYTGWGWGWLDGTDFRIRKDHGLTDRKDFLGHLPCDSWTIVQYRAMGGWTSNANLHPWKHGDYVLAGQGGFTGPAGPHERLCVGTVDTERMAAYLGMHGAMKTFKDWPGKSALAIDLKGNLLTWNVEVCEHNGVLLANARPTGSKPVAVGRYFYKGKYFRSTTNGPNYRPEYIENPRAFTDSYRLPIGKVDRKGNYLGYNKETNRCDLKLELPPDAS